LSMAKLKRAALAYVLAGGEVKNPNHLRARLEVLQCSRSTTAKLSAQ
jgi:hypothetical protein